MYRNGSTSSIAEGNPKDMKAIDNMMIILQAFRSYPYYVKKANEEICAMLRRMNFENVAPWRTKDNKLVDGLDINFGKDSAITYLQSINEYDDCFEGDELVMDYVCDKLKGVILLEIDKNLNVMPFTKFLLNTLWSNRWGDMEIIPGSMYVNEDKQKSNLLELTYDVYVEDRFADIFSAMNDVADLDYVESSDVEVANFLDSNPANDDYNPNLSESVSVPRRVPRRSIH